MYGGHACTWDFNDWDAVHGAASGEMKHFLIESTQIFRATENDFLYKKLARCKISELKNQSDPAVNDLV